MTAAAELVGVTFGYDVRKPILQEFSWEIQAGASWALIGPSGGGKTTLLYLLAGLRKPQTGQVLVGNLPVIKPRRSTGLILQDYGLLPWATARDNIALGLKIRGADKARRHKVVDHWLQTLDIAAVAGRYPAQLSGGQRQRVAIARTLALDPDLLLMDEPFSALDALTREALQNELIALGLTERLTSVLVTHNIEEAVFLGKRIGVLGPTPMQTLTVVENPQAGKLDYRGKPEFYACCEQIRMLVERQRNGKQNQATPVPVLKQEAKI